MTVDVWLRDGGATGILVVSNALRVSAKLTVMEHSSSKAA